jgi:hypothetical protein
VTRPAAWCAWATIAAAIAAQAPESQPASRPAVDSRPGAAAARPRSGARLVVAVVVDQLSAEVYEGARPYFGEGGFARLEREGARFPQAAFEHACTETAAGHATLSCGAPPSVHGIVANDWPDPRTGAAVNAVHDPAVRALGPPPGASTKGATLARLRAPTFGDALKAAAGPQAKVVGVSLKARSSLLMTGRSADFAGWLDYETGWWATSPDHGPTAPAFLADWNARDVVAAAFGGTWEKEGPAAAYEFLGEDASPFERGLDGRSAFPHLLRTAAGGVREKDAQAALSTPFGNELVLDATFDLLPRFALGKDDVPDYLFVGFSANDLVGHQYGPWSHEARSAAIAVDRQLTALLQRLDLEVGKGRYTLALSADHGVGPIPEAAAKAGLPAGRVDSRKVRGAIESALVASFGDPTPARYTKAVWGYHCVLDHETLATRGAPRETAAEIAAAAAATVPGVGRVVSLPALDRRPPRDAIETAVQKTGPPDRLGDLWVLPLPYHLFSANPASHGTPYVYDRRVPLFFFGAGVKPGYVGVEATSPAALATTLAASLGIAGPALADAPPLRCALQ